MKPLPSPEIAKMLCTFEALRTLGWPSRSIYFINARNGRAGGRESLFVTLQWSPKSHPIFSWFICFLDGPERETILNDMQPAMKAWNADSEWRDRIWNETPFDRVDIVFALTKKGLDVGPERKTG